MSGWFDQRWRHGGADEILLSARLPHLPSPPVPKGRLWLCGKHFVGPDPEAAMLHVQATTIVCLTQQRELESRYPEYVTWLRRQPPERAMWFPIPDLGAPPLEMLTPLLVELCRRIEDGNTLLVHCAAGIGRSGTIAVAILMTMGISRQHALESVANSRAMAGPEAGAQRDLLRALEQG